ncbi:hypothetical protein AVDCRST_MAG81-2834 [uncultured Synechococcales cyanobacterium]|uniref:Glycosyltransferase 2-like domain-containing protein n=1 Tax=uncultured Synechococcales cyanobacterium TaxID=1936017 RepID=A0A6J4VMK2_9CYAN|nr:hypothetical protein AVDCRST_MAG81-2834 [uncultured Synechococcales cyanobacterium]
MKSLSELAVIIPVAPGDAAWTDLIIDLNSLPVESEILFVGSLPTKTLRPLFEQFAKCRNTRWVQAPTGRGYQLNAGVKATQKPYLWLLHADSRFDQSALHALQKSLQQQPNALHYFNLAFLNDGPALTAINAVGVWFRSHLLGLPFGDQGFCLTRTLFNQLGGLREDVSYGEDHLLIWQAHIQGISLRCTGELLQTSARKYQKHGWCATTLNHLALTAKQAFPEWMKLFKVRFWFWRATLNILKIGNETKHRDTHLSEVQNRKLNG